MDLATIKKEVLIKLQDSDPEIFDRITQFANEVIRKAMEEVEPPEFKVLGSVTTASNQLSFTGGTDAFAIGDIVTGGTSGAYATVTSVTVSTGSWAGDDAAGVLGVTTQTGTFESEVLTSDNGGSGTIASDSTPALAYTSMPSGFSGKLLFIGTENRDIEVVDFDELVDLYPDMDTVGNVVRVAVVGSTLYYQGIPSTAETIPIVYRRNPTDMVAGTSEPDGIPEMLHREIVVCGAAMIAWDLIEDGIEGDKVNYLSQKFQFDKGMDRFHGWVRKRTSNRSKSVWRY